MQQRRGLQVHIHCSQEHDARGRECSREEGCKFTYTVAMSMMRRECSRRGLQVHIHCSQEHDARGRECSREEGCKFTYTVAMSMMQGGGSAAEKRAASPHTL